MDIQRMMDSVSDAIRNTRKDYHLTLGDLMERMTDLPDDTAVLTDRGFRIGREHSYRGYYHDLAFDPGDEQSFETVADLRAACERANSQTYTGYKGGDYSYGGDTPLWLANYGCTGFAIIDAVVDPRGLVLILKDVD